MGTFRPLLGVSLRDMVCIEYYWEGDGGVSELDAKRAAGTLVLDELILALPWAKMGTCGLYVACEKSCLKETKAAVKRVNSTLIEAETSQSDARRLIDSLVGHYVTLHLGIDSQWIRLGGDSVVFAEKLFQKATDRGARPMLRAKLEISVINDSVSVTISVPEQCRFVPLAAEHLISNSSAAWRWSRLGSLDGEALQETRCIVLPTLSAGWIQGMSKIPPMLPKGADSGLRTANDFVEFWRYTYGIPLGGEFGAFVHISFGSGTLTYPESCLWRTEPLSKPKRGRNRGHLVGSVSSENGATSTEAHAITSRLIQALGSIKVKVMAMGKSSGMNSSKGKGKSKSVVENVALFDFESGTGQHSATPLNLGPAQKPGFVPVRAITGVIERIKYFSKVNTNEPVPLSGIDRDDDADGGDLGDDMFASTSASAAAISLTDAPDMSLAALLTEHKSTPHPLPMYLAQPRPPPAIVVAGRPGVLISIPRFSKALPVGPPAASAATSANAVATATYSMPAAAPMPIVFGRMSAAASAPTSVSKSAPRVKGKEKEKEKEKGKGKGKGKPKLKPKLKGSGKTVAVSGAAAKASHGDIDVESPPTPTPTSAFVPTHAPKASYAPPSQPYAFSMTGDIGIGTEGTPHARVSTPAPSESDPEVAKAPRKPRAKAAGAGKGKGKRAVAAGEGEATAHVGGKRIRINFDTSTDDDFQ